MLSIGRKVSGTSKKLAVLKKDTINLSERSNIDFISNPISKDIRRVKRRSKIALQNADKRAEAYKDDFSELEELCARLKCIK